MSDYAKSTNFTAKDSTNDIILGAEYDAEYSAIATSVATKANKVTSPTSGNIASLTSGGDIQDSGVAASQVTTNATNIATNTTNIATNTTNIATNTTNIATNTTDIANLQSGVGIGLILGTPASVGTGNSVTKSLSGTVQEIMVYFHGVSTNGYAGSCLLGTGGALESAAGNGHKFYVYSATTADADVNFPGVASSTAGAYTYGRVRWRHLGSNVWHFELQMWELDSPDVIVVHHGYQSVSGVVDTVGIDLATSGVFDAGTWVVDYRRSA